MAAVHGRQFSPLFRLFPLFLLQRVVGPLLRGQQKFGQRLIAQGRVGEKNHQQRNAYADDVEGQPYSLPTSLAGIVKNRLRHERLVSIHPKLRYSDGQ